MGIVEILQRRDAFHGALRQLIERGVVFQLDAAGRRVPVRDPLERSGDDGGASVTVNIEKVTA